MILFNEMTISSYDLFEIILGLFFIWIGVYVFSRNPFSAMSWIVFGFLFGFSITIGTEPILSHATSLQEYVRWQKITDWPLFFSPVFGFHASTLAGQLKKNLNKYLLGIGYILALLFTLIDIRGGWVLKESVIRFADYRRFDGFAPGVLLIPSIVFVCIYLVIGTIYFLQNTEKHFWKYFLPALGCLIIAFTGVIVAISFYRIIPIAEFLFTFGSAAGVLLFVYSIVRYHLFTPAEKIIFDNVFFFRACGIVVIVVLYWLAFLFSQATITFEIFAFIVITAYLLIFSHSFYDWLITFTNDLLFNPEVGLSVVSDQETGEAIKNYNSPDRLESSTLLQLLIVQRKKESGQIPIDNLRSLVKDAVEYFRPEQDSGRRTKRNLKYYLLKMIAYDEAEEGQILWELGFEDYPVRIMTKESNKRPPLFQITSPSDYSYTSRNAYLALKKEAIHDVTWRISYLEKLSRRH